MVSLDYDKMHLFDAEDLAEGGIGHAYQRVRDIISQYVGETAEIQEVIDDSEPSYTVKCRGQAYPIYSPVLVDDEGQSWGRATHAFFKIVNDQLVKSKYRLYAINGGNDLGGMFLSDTECEAARKSLLRKEDWPYLPTLEHPWYGQPHD